MMNKPCMLAVVTTAALFGAATPALAQSSNLNLWTAAGDVQVLSASQAVLTTAATLSGEIPLTANSALQFFDLEPALSIPGATAADTYEGSGLAQSFVSAAGTTVSFNWTLGTAGFDANFADRAFVVIDGAPALDFATVAATALNGSFSYTFTTAGNHSLAIAVMDVNDYVGVSTLTVSNLTVTAVPEPTSIALLLAGLGVVGALARRRS